MASFNISIFDDTVDENNENFMLNINSTSLPVGFFVGNPNVATVIITDNDGKLIFVHSIFVKITNKITHFKAKLATLQLKMMIMWDHMCKII